MTSRGGAKAEQAGARVRNNDAYRHLVTVGLIAYGVVHLLVAWIALLVAWSDASSQDASQSGALRTMAQTPAGPYLLTVVGVGFVALTVWQGLEAAFGHGRVAEENDEKKQVAKRVGSAGRAVVYAVLAYTAFSFAWGSGGSGSGGSSNSKEEGLVASLMSTGPGRFLVIAIGLGILAVGIHQIYRGLARRFEQELAGSVPDWVTPLGVAGYCAKGLALGVVGVLFAWAAISYDPKKAGGLDDALRTFRDAPAGPWLLTLVALGLACFGAYCFVWSRNAKI